MKKIFLIFFLIVMAATPAAAQYIGSLTEDTVPNKSSKIEIETSTPASKYSTIENLIKYGHGFTGPGGLTIDDDDKVVMVSYSTLRSLIGLVIGSNVQAWDTDLDTAALANAASVSTYFGKNASGTVGFHSLPASSGLGFDVDAPGASGAFLRSNGTKWERVTSISAVEFLFPTVSAAIYSDSSGYAQASTAVSKTELEYLDGVTSAIQTQIDNKAPKLVSQLNSDQLNDSSTPHLLTAAEVSGTIINNYGATPAAREYDLPAAATGYNFVLVLGAAQNVTIDPNGTEIIYLNGATLAAGEAVVNTAPSIGESITCYTIQTGSSTWSWVCKSGDSDFAEETP